jgi:ParB family transcriptional regulator, chromosome partitioning protein
MAESIQLLDPRRLKANPENPRLIFREDELRALEESIAEQGILVPLTLFRDGRDYILLDGERRWRCAVKLGLDSVPAIVQPKPDRLTNIMMMFAIHNARRDWDPLPTAYKLQQLEQEYTLRHGSPPSEIELAGLASLSRGEVRRLRNLLSLPARYRRELLKELEKPASQQLLTVDHVLEATRGAAALRKRDIVDSKAEDELRQALISKFRSGVIKNTVAPRQLARIARAVDRGEVTGTVARRVTRRLIDDPDYTIADAFEASVEQVDFEHATEQLAERLLGRLLEHERRGYKPGESLSATLRSLSRAIRKLLA